MVSDVGEAESRSMLRIPLQQLGEEVSGFTAIAPSGLDDYGIDANKLALLHRAGLLLYLGGRMALLPDADERAVELLGALHQPVTTSAARQAMETNRRTAINLLDHLDRTGRTVRLLDDRRRVRSSL